MLSAQNRLRSSKDFARVTKTGDRATTASLVLYCKHDLALQADPQIGLIISKAIGGSVTRHSIARKLRHAGRELLDHTPKNSQLVIRVIGASDDYAGELKEAIRKISSRIGVSK